MEGAGVVRPCEAGTHRSNWSPVAGCSRNRCLQVAGKFLCNWTMALPAWPLDTTLSGKVSLTAVSDPYGGAYPTYDNLDCVTEEVVEKVLLDIKADEKAAKHLAAAVNRMLLVNPDRFRV